MGNYIKIIMGGHDGLHRNMNNLQETDEEMTGKIQRIETIKHMPNLWHMEFFNGSNMLKIFGGAPATAYMGTGIAVALMYFKNGAQHAPQSFYALNLRMWGRVIIGGMAGLTAGYMQFGDRQRLHNGWVAERLRRRYPECVNLKESDLWTLKMVKSEHAYYKWT